MPRGRALLSFSCPGEGNCALEEKCMQIPGGVAGGGEGWAMIELIPALTVNVKTRLFTFVTCNVL